MEKHRHKIHHRADKKDENPNMKLLIMTIALALLIIISGVQAVQLVGLKTKLNANLEDMAISASKTKVSTGSSGSLSKNLENLPTMVGGC